MTASGRRGRLGTGKLSAITMDRVARVCQKALVFPRAWLTAMIAAGLLGGCGANMQAVYEGDVRFEHCMALEMRQEMRDRLRRECWVEWLAYYTYGQTRDRVSHAELRIQQLSSDETPVEPPGG